MKIRLNKITTSDWHLLAADDKEDLIHSHCTVYIWLVYVFCKSVHNEWMNELMWMHTKNRKKGGERTQTIFVLHFFFVFYLCLVSKKNVDDRSVFCCFFPRTIISFRFQWCQDNSGRLFISKPIENCWNKRLLVHKSIETQFNWMELNEIRPTMDFLENYRSKYICAIAQSTDDIWLCSRYKNINININNKTRMEE